MSGIVNTVKPLNSVELKFCCFVFKNVFVGSKFLCMMIYYMLIISSLCIHKINTPLQVSVTT